MSHKPSRAMIYKRDKNSCQYCGSTRNLTIDHVVPRCRGGDDSWENLVVACSPCNTRKGNFFLEHTGMRLLKRPRAPFNKMQFILDNSNIQEWLEYSF
jgi:5-methylcytosine-specific restriction endonuclease McrA